MSTSIRTNVKESPVGGVIPAGCGGGGAASPGPVYVMGALGFDFGTYARRDAFQAVNNGMPLAVNSDLSNYLVVTPVDAESVIWTLSINNAPVYAVRPSGTFAKATYQQLQAYLVDPNIDLVSVPGTIAGSITLLNGQAVPVVQPDVRGLKTWSSTSLVAPPATLAGSVAAFQPGTSPSFYLTGEGTVDWLHAGLNQATDRNDKQRALLPGLPLGNGQIALSTGAGTPVAASGFAASFSWIDGTPTGNFTPGPGLNPGLITLTSANAFVVTAPADTTTRVLRLYVRTIGGAATNSTLSASFSPGPSLTYADSSLSTLVAGNPLVVDGVYTLTYCGTAPGQTLRVLWQANAPATAGFQAASLQIAALSRSSALQSYLDRLYFELRNMGLSSQERAINYASAYAMTQGQPRLSAGALVNPTIFGATFAQGMALEDITARRNESCRPLADCWDVLFRFFNPASNTEGSRVAFRVTVDVSLVKPVNVVQVQRWAEI